MKFRLCLLVLSWTILGSITRIQADPPTSPSWVVTTISGEKHEAPSLNIAHQQWLLGRGEKLQKFDSDQILSVSLRQEQRFSNSLPKGNRGCRITLSNDDQFLGQIVDFNDTSISMTPFLSASEKSDQPPPRLMIPLEYIVRLTWFQESAPIAPDSAVSRSQPANQDLLTLSNGDHISGELIDFSTNKLTLETENGSQDILVENIDSLSLNPELVISLPNPPSRILLRLQDGSRMTAQSFELIDFNQIQLTTSFGKSWRISLNHVTSFLALNAERIPLSIRSPEEVNYTPFLKSVPHWQADQNVLNQPLKMQSAEYLTGLGMHSQTEITWPLEKDDQTFLADIGIDDITGGQGSVQFVVLVDDRAVFESGIVRGGTTPQMIQIDLTGKKTLTLRVTFGEQGDVQDRADWGHALILKATSSE